MTQHARTRYDNALGHGLRRNNPALFDYDKQGQSLAHLTVEIQYQAADLAHARSAPAAQGEQSTMQLLAKIARKGR